MQSALEAHAVELKNLAIALAQTAFGYYADWSEIFFEACVDAGGTRVDRTIVRNEKSRKDIHPNSEAGTCVVTLQDIREDLPGEKWIGISMLVTRDGEVDVQYSYDTNWQQRFFNDFKEHRPF